MPRNSSLGNPFAPPLRERRILYPAGVCVLALLAIGTVLAALPSFRRIEVVSVALTSGGKFAARIPQTEAQARPRPEIALPALVQPTRQAAAPWLSLTSLDALFGHGPTLDTPVVTGGWPVRPRLPDLPLLPR